MGHLIPAGTGFHANRLGEMLKVAPDVLPQLEAADGNAGNGDADEDKE